MGKGYLIDSNAVIDFFKGVLPEKGKYIIANTDPIISIITHIEIFSSNSISENDFKKLKSFVTAATIYTIDQSIVLRTISLRLNYKIKLPDAIIAATALHHGLILITRNIADFVKIKGLKVIDPYKI